MTSFDTSNCHPVSSRRMRPAASDCTALSSPARLFVTSVQALLVSLTVAGCGGGGGIDTSAGSPTDITTQDDDPLNPTSTPGSAQQPSDALPNLVVADLITSRETDRSGDLSVSATIANTGEGSFSASGTTSAWLLISDSADFSSGYHLNVVNLFSTGSGDGMLGTGEQETFTASYGLAGNADLELTRYGTHYARLWVNPDRSAIFDNPEDIVVESHFLSESNYEDNLSDIVSFEHPVPTSGPHETYICHPDALEENDDLSTASPVALNTSYTINVCDDIIDVVSFVLDAGQVIEIKMGGEGSAYWDRSVIAPDGTYVVRHETRGATIVRAEQSGTYRLAFRHVWYSVTGDGSRESTFVLETLR